MFLKSLIFGICATLIGGVIIDKLSMTVTGIALMGIGVSALIFAPLIQEINKLNK